MRAQRIYKSQGQEEYWPVLHLRTLSFSSTPQEIPQIKHFDRLVKQGQVNDLLQNLSLAPHSVWGWLNVRKDLFQGWKKPVFFLNPAQWIFLGFSGFLGFLGFFHIFAQKREFLGFFSFKNTFRCIQTLNCNHSY